MLSIVLFSFFFFFNDTATTEIYTLSLHDALPIFIKPDLESFRVSAKRGDEIGLQFRHESALKFQAVGRKNIDRKSTRLNSSHQIISYAVFCLKKKNKKEKKYSMYAYNSYKDLTTT